MATITDNDLRELKDLINSKFDRIDTKFERIDHKLLFSIFSATLSPPQEKEQIR